MLRNKGNVSVRNITVTNIWVHKVNVSQQWKPAMIATSCTTVGVRYAWFLWLTWNTTIQMEVFPLLVSREHKHTSDRLAVCCVVTCCDGGRWRFPRGGCTLQRFLYRHAPGRSNSLLQPVALQAISSNITGQRLKNLLCYTKLFPVCSTKQEHS